MKVSLGEELDEVGLCEAERWSLDCLEEVCTSLLVRTNCQYLQNWEIKTVTFRSDELAPALVVGNFNCYLSYSIMKGYALYYGAYFHRHKLLFSN